MSTVNVCGKCKNSIEGGQNAVIALGQKFHATCFVCPICSKPFEKGFLDVSGQPYHQECMPVDDELISRDCAKCYKKIEGTVVTAVGKSFHTECFSCRGCNKVIPSDGSFDLFRNEIYHPNCVPPEALPTCKTCLQQCHEKSLVFEGNFYHEGCLPKCKKCGICLNTKYQQRGEDFYHFPGCVPPEEKCTHCNKTLTNPAVGVDSKSYHQDCFKCQGCNRPFGTTYVKYDDTNRGLVQYFHEECQPGHKQ